MPESEFAALFPPKRVRRTYDRTGLNELTVGTEVQITHPRHAYYGLIGTVVRVNHTQHRVWVTLDDGTTVPAGSRSVQSQEENRASQA